MPKSTELQRMALRVHKRTALCERVALDLVSLVRHRCLACSASDWIEPLCMVHTRLAAAQAVPPLTMLMRCAHDAMGPETSGHPCESDLAR